MQAARRVYVFAPGSEQCLRIVHRAEAQRMIATGRARRRCSSDTMRAIELTETPGRPLRAPSPPRLTQFMGQRYTYVERLEVNHRLVALKHIDRRDQPLFLLSVTDCGGRLRRVHAALPREAHPTARAAGEASSSAGRGAPEEMR